MDLSPHLARTIAFRIVRKGYDPSEVDAFRERAASAIEAAQNQATAMEARARAAVSKLQEATQAAAERRADAPAATAAPPAPVESDLVPTGESLPAMAPPAVPTADPAQVAASASDAETISRTLLLAQRTAERTVADAEQQADTVRAEARAEADRLIDEAKAEARRQATSERADAINEVQALLARRDFLVSDVEHLEIHIAGQRDRVRGVADTLLDLAEHPQAGLGDARRPLLSASDGGSTGSGLGQPVTSDGTMPAESTAVDAFTPADDDVAEPTPVQSEIHLGPDDDSHS